MRHFEFGATVGEWFDWAAEAPEGAACRADGAPGTIPEWVVEADLDVQREFAATTR